MITTSSLELNSKKQTSFLLFVVDSEYRLYNAIDIVNYSNIYSQSFDYTQSKEVIDYLILTKYRYPDLYNTITLSIKIDSEYFNISNILSLNVDAYINDILLSKFLKLNNDSFKKVSTNRYTTYIKLYDIDFTDYLYPNDLRALNYVQFRYPGITLDLFLDKKLKIIRYVSRHVKNWDVIHPRNNSFPFLYKTLRTPENPDVSTRLQYSLTILYPLLLYSDNMQHVTYDVYKVGAYNIIPSIYNKFLLYVNNLSNSIQLYFSGCLPASNYNLLAYYNNIWSTITLNYYETTPIQYDYSLFSSSTYLVYRPKWTTDEYRSYLDVYENRLQSYYMSKLNVLSNLVSYFYNLPNNTSTTYIDLIYNHTDKLSKLLNNLTFMFGCGYYTVSILFKLTKYRDVNRLKTNILYSNYLNSNVNNVDAINMIKSLTSISLPPGLQWARDYITLILVPYNALESNLKYSWRVSTATFGGILFYNKFIRYTGNQFHTIIDPTGYSAHTFNGHTAPYSYVANVNFSGSHILTKSIIYEPCMLDTIGQFCNIVNHNTNLSSMMPLDKSYFDYWYDLKQATILLSQQYPGFYNLKYVIYKKFNDSAKIGIGLKPPAHKLKRNYNVSQFNEYTLYGAVDPYNVNLSAWGGDFYLSVSVPMPNDKIYTASEYYYLNSNTFYKLLDFYRFLLKSFSIEKADVI